MVLIKLEKYEVEKHEKYMVLKNMDLTNMVFKIHGLKKVICEQFGD